MKFSETAFQDTLNNAMDQCNNFPYTIVTELGLDKSIPTKAKVYCMRVGK